MTKDNVPDSIHYGFMLNDELLHLQWLRVEDLYLLVKKEPEEETHGEWVTNNLPLILHMYLKPDYYRGVHASTPKPALDVGEVVAIRTWRTNNVLYKSYTPLEIPDRLPPGKLAPSQSMGVSTYRQVSSYKGDVVVGTIYHTLDGINEEPTFHECIAQVGDEYLLLSLTEGELTNRVVWGFR